MELAAFCRLLEDVLELGTIGDGGDTFGFMEGALLEVGAQPRAVYVHVLCMCHRLVQDIQIVWFHACGHVTIAQRVVSFRGGARTHPRMRRGC